MTTPLPLSALTSLQLSGQIVLPLLSFRCGIDDLRSLHRWRPNSTPLTSRLGMALTESPPSPLRTVVTLGYHWMDFASSPGRSSRFLALAVPFAHNATLRYIVMDRRRPLFARCRCGHVARLKPFVLAETFGWDVKMQ